MGPGLLLSGLVDILEEGNQEGAVSVSPKLETFSRQ